MSVLLLGVRDDSLTIRGWGWGVDPRHVAQNACPNGDSYILTPCPPPQGTFTVNESNESMLSEGKAAKTM